MYSHREGGGYDFIAPYWVNLDPELGGTIHYLYDTESDRLVVQYTEIQKENGSGSVTFQVILHPSGSILFQYLDMPGDMMIGSIGMEKAIGISNIGLSIACYEAYVHNNLAVLIEDSVPWLTETPAKGLIVPDYYQVIDVCVDASTLAQGEYSCDLVIQCNDPSQPQITVPAIVTVRSPSGIQDDRVTRPTAYRLYQNTPNPFNAKTSIQYDLPVASTVRLRIYDVRGRLVYSFGDEPNRSPGRYSVAWDGRDNRGSGVASGVYFFRLETDFFNDTQRMVLVK